MPHPSSSAARLAATLSSLIALGVKDQETHRRILKETLENHPHHFGVWAWWESGMIEDSSGSNESSSRFCWRRSRTELLEENGGLLLDSDSQPQRACSEASKARRPFVQPPYVATFDKVERLLSTVAIPIMMGQKCLGVAGMDFALDTLAANVSTGCSKTMMEAMDIITAELHAGLIFLDGEQNVIAWSSSAPVMLGEFIKDSLELGRALPSDLSPATSENRNGSGLEKTIDHRGSILKATRSGALANLPMVMMLTKEEVEIKIPPLSDREDQVMRWLSEGKSNEEIGIILSISPHTVKNHLDRIYRKIGVDNRHAAMLAWTRARALSGILPTL